MLLAAVCKNEVKLYAYASGEDDSQSEPTLMKTIEGGVTNGDGFMWNASGTLCGVISKTGGVVVYDVIKNFALSFEAPSSLKGIKQFYFSPLSTYLVTAERFESKTPTSANMALWHVAGKARIVEGRLRKITGGHIWPSMKWTDDEKCCCRVLSPEDSPDQSVRESYLLQVLNSKTSKTENIEIQGISLVEVCPTRNSTRVAIFVNENDQTGRRASIRIFDLSSPEKELISHEFVTSVDACTMRWSPSGDRLLIQAGTEVDETGNSYYGTSKLFLGDLNAKKIIPILHEPPVQDYQWVPSMEFQDRGFCLISGQTPFSIQMFDNDGTSVLHDFKKSRKNTIRFSSIGGRFLALGGFGNLAGELDFYDIPSRKIFRSTRAECTVECSWAPNGRVFMTSSTHPRMRVDNHIELFKFNGEKIGRLNFPELYAAKWRPMPNAKFADTPASLKSFVVNEPEVVKKAYKAPSGASRSSTPPPPEVQVSPKIQAPPPPPPPAPTGRPVKMPCPEREWFYTDPAGNLQGPFTRQMMLNWFKGGYLKADLPVRAGSVLPFVPLTDLFPLESTQAFESSMVVPPQWLSFKQ